MFRTGRSAYDFPPYRPPNEASSALIRVTRGCPWNRCKFCTMYKDVEFRMKPPDEVKDHIDEAADIYRGTETLFVADSDSLVSKDIGEIVRHIKKRFPEIKRITSYARARTLRNLGAEKLKRIKEAGLTRVHVGLESGDPETLKFMEKGATPEIMIGGGRAAKEAGIEVSLYYLIGAGGKERLEEHARASSEVCNEIQPDFIRARTLVVQRGSPLSKKMEKGDYVPTTPGEKLRETRSFLGALDIDGCEYASDHFTNNIWIGNRIAYGGIYGRLPSEKERMLDVVDEARERVRSAEEEAVDATILYERGMIRSL